MYESFFGLRKRPFAAMPDPDCFVPVDATCQAFDDLYRCVSEGRGIGVLTAPAGLGKTLVCQRLARELSARFTIIQLPTGNFLTRRELLQAVLFELGHSYVRMADQELRLTLSATLRAIQSERRSLVVIVDEAHLLAARMLEELRTLLTLAEAGEPLVRLVVSGQLSLEETLSRPECDAFNQRIAGQVVLQSLSREESIDYVSRRLAWAGANVSDVLGREALVGICEASDGVPRCLHQLADLSLAMAAGRNEKPVTYATVRDALDELKHLPLSWAEPTVGRKATSPLELARAQGPAGKSAMPLADKSKSTKTPTPDRIESDTLEVLDLDDDPHVDAEGAYVLGSDTFDSSSKRKSNDVHSHSAAFEAEDFDGGDFDALQPETTDDSVAVEFGVSFETPVPAPREIANRNEKIVTSKLPVPNVVMPEPVERYEAPANTLVDEEVVIDRYAALDAAINRLTRTMLNARGNSRRKTTTLVAAAHATAPAPVAPIEVTAQQRFDVVLPEEGFTPDDHRPNGPSEPKSTTRAKMSIDAASSVKAGMHSPTKAGVAVQQATAVEAVTPASSPAPNERRPYQLLFSELRRRRRA